MFSIKTHIFVLAFFVICTAITGAAFVQYKAAFTVLDFTQSPGAIEDWSIRGPEGDVGITNAELHLRRSSEDLVSAFRHFQIKEMVEDGPNRYFVNVSTTITKTTSDPNPRSVSFDESSIMVISFFSGDGERLIVHIPVDITHGQSIEAVNDYISVPLEASELAVGFYIRKADDQFSISDLKLAITQKRDSYPYLVGLLATAFLVYLLMIIRQMLSSGSASLSFAYAGTILGGAVVVLIPGLKERAYSWLWQFQTPDQPELLASIATFLADNIEQLGHLSVFLVISLAAFSLSSKHQSSAISVAIGLVLLALGTEAVQLHISDRSATTLDLAYDGLGIAIGAAIFYVPHLLRNKDKLSSETVT